MDGIEQYSLKSFEELIYELREKDSEIARHHRDFKLISSLCDAVDNKQINPTEFHHAVRNIVG